MLLVTFIYQICFGQAFICSFSNSIKILNLHLSFAVFRKRDFEPLCYLPRGLEVANFSAQGKLSTVQQSYLLLFLTSCFFQIPPDGTC